MIRLIASDMDGTLLDSRKRLPEGFADEIRSLYERGILFAVASGRQYAALRRDLEALVPYIYFICENGALVMYRDEQVLIDPMDAADLLDTVTACRALDGVFPVVCRASEGLFEATADPAFIRETQIHYPSSRVVEDHTAHCAYTDVCKVAFYDRGDAQTHELPVLNEKLGSRLSVILSGQNWVDVMKMGVNKGTAMRRLQQMLGIAPEECMAFGDYLNDYELLESVGESYAMANSHPLLLEMAKYTAPSNDEDGVMRVIRERFSL
ncbi:MAG: HAD family phosphatase [Clostridia bacterium]|nr:HAD family phosphatase [Clostridia bacterium]